MPPGDRAFGLPGDAARWQAALAVEGTRACSEAGCQANTGVPCAYTDRRSHRCGTAWCPTHRLVLGTTVYCRRHAGVVTALGDANPLPTTALPDVDNRAPSLAAWVARAVDADVWRLLLGEIGSETCGQLLADPVTLVFYGVQRRRTWERAWKLVTHTGVARRVSVIVEEAADTEVVVKVGSHEVARAVPPWIEHRRREDRVDPEDDARERHAFYQRLTAAIGRGLQAEREREGVGWAQ